MSCNKLHLYRQFSCQFLLTKYYKHFAMQNTSVVAAQGKTFAPRATLLSCSPNLLRVFILRYMHNCHQKFCPWRRRMLNKYIWFRTNLRIHQTQCWGRHFKCMWLYMLHQHDVGQNMSLSTWFMHSSHKVI